MECLNARVEYFNASQHMNIFKCEYRTSTRTRTFSSTEDGLKESRNIFKYR